MSQNCSIPGLLGLLLWFPILACGQESSAEISITISGARQIAQTPNFQITTTLPQLDLRRLAAACEARRSRLLANWYGSDSPRCEQRWSPKCEIVIHATQSHYRGYLGAGAGGSVGCTTISVNRGAVSQRRIDLRADAQGWQVDALPHELTHVVLADQFGNRPLPLWADEGMGVLGESLEKRLKRCRAAEVCEQQNQPVTAANLLFDTSLPRSRKVDAFYFRSCELVQFLIDRKGAPEFLNFLDAAMSRGYETALRQHYDINGVGELQQLWQTRELLTETELISQSSR